MQEGLFKERSARILPEEKWSTPHEELVEEKVCFT
jgi:hypothetical protein